MADERIKKLAEILVGYSVDVKEGERVRIEAFTHTEPLYREVHNQVLMRGAHPSMQIILEDMEYDFYKLASEEQLKHFPEYKLHWLENTDVSIVIRGPKNPKMLSNIASEKISLYKRTMQPIFEQKHQHTRWTLAYYPTYAQAQEAGMSLQEFEDFVYEACLIDWEEESKNQDRIKEVFDKGKIIRIIGEGTDLTFSIEGRLGMKCDGHYNMPDGEVFYSPVEDSANGIISYSFPAIYEGKEVEGIRLKFKNGEVVRATAEKNEDFLRKMVDTDEGSRLIGEFGIGTNPNIDRFIKNMLYDEKMEKTIHIALGTAWKMAGGTIESAIHWDMLKDMRDGEIWVDSELVQKNGLLVFDK